MKKGLQIIKNKIKYLYIWFDYAVLLFCFSLLPQSLGRYLAKIRGVLYFYRKRDWRSFTFKDYGLHERVYNTYQELFPHYNHKEILSLVKQRYISQSIEEFEAALCMRDKYRKITVHYKGIENIQKLIDEDQSIMFVSGHFGTIYGFLFFDFIPSSLYAMTADITKMKMVHPAIVRFNLQKYKSLKKYMNGGEFLPFEGNRKKFIKALKNGSNAIVIIDLPPSGVNEEVLWVDFLGKKRGVASGSEKIAKTTGSVIVPYVCYFENGSYVVEFGSPDDNPYDFLGREIKKRPQLWWASDLLGTYRKMESVD